MVPVTYFVSGDSFKCSSALLALAVLGAVPATIRLAPHAVFEHARTRLVEEV